MSHESHQKDVATALAALGHEARLTVFRLLVRSGRDGLTVSQIQEHVNFPPSTLAHHLRTLVLAHLVVQEKHGREVISRPDFDVMNATLSFLTSECCHGISSSSDAA